MKFTLIGGFNPALIKKWCGYTDDRQKIKAALARACNSDPDRKVVISEHINAIPKNVPMCALPYEVKDTDKVVNKNNFHKANWVCLDVDNQDLPDDKKWDRKRLYEYFKKLGYTFHICGSITDGNFKVYILCEECDNVEKYEHFNSTINTMIEGLGDPNYQGKLTFVKGYLSGHTGNTLFTCDYDPNTTTTKYKKMAPSGIIGVNSADDIETNEWDKELHKKLSKEFKNAMTIRGRCMKLVGCMNGTYNLHLSDEKSPGGYFIRPGESIYIYKAGAGKIKYTPQEFFIDDSDNHKIYNLLRELCNGPSAIAMMMNVDKDLAIDTLCDKKIIRNEIFRKAGCKVKERDNKGKWNLTFIYQGTRYYSKNRADMIKLLKRLGVKVIELLKSKVSKWMTSFKCSKNHVHGSKIYYSFYKGRTEEQITKTHNKMMEAIKGWFKKEKTPERIINYSELRDMRILI